MRHGVMPFAGARHRAPLSFALLGLLALAAAGRCQAHVTLEVPQAAAGSYYQAVFRVGHGCEGSPAVLLEVVPSPQAGHVH